MDQKIMGAYFKEYHLKATPQRLAIGKYLFKSKSHPTAEELYKQVVEEQPSISLATIYKTLNVFKEKGLIRELEMGNSGSRYEPNLVPHVNIVCPICGDIQDLHSPLIQNFISEIDKLLANNSASQRLDFFVKCDKCSESDD